MRSVADEIEAYVAKHPGAADTVAGISSFWLSGVPERLVQEALEDLVRRRVMKRQDVPGGGAVYSRAAGR